MDERFLVDAAETLSRSLTPTALDETLRRITRGAVDALPGVDHASITVRHDDGRLESVAPTDDVAATLDARQFSLEQGPCYEAATRGDHVVAPDLATEERFAAYAAEAAAVGVAAQVGLRLFTAEDRHGVLNLYSRVPGTFANVTELGDLFNQRSDAAASHARELEAVRAAAREAELVGRAVGIVMERYGFSQQDAFAFLTRLADHHHVEPRQVAEALIAASNGRAD